MTDLVGNAPAFLFLDLPDPQEMLVLSRILHVSCLILTFFSWPPSHFFPSPLKFQS